MGETTRAQISLCFRPASLRSSVWARLLDMAAGRIMVAVVVNFSDFPAEAKVFYLQMLLSFTDGGWVMTYSVLFAFFSLRRAVFDRIIVAPRFCLSC